MSSENSEKQHAWKLEEQLENEKYEHKKTKSALHVAQEKLQQIRTIVGDLEVKNPKDDSNLGSLTEVIEDLRRENSRLVASKNESQRFMEKLKLQNEDLKKVLIRISLVSGVAIVYLLILQDPKWRSILLSFLSSMLTPQHGQVS